MKRLSIALALAAFMIGSMVVAISAQAPTFTSRIESVRVDALVTRNGQPVLGLQPDDFDVLDNGVRQQIDHVSFDLIPVNLVLVLDASESVAGSLLDQLRLAGRSVIAALRGGDQTALVTFSHRVAQPLPLTPDVNRLSEVLDHAQAGGGTALIDAAYSALWVAQADPGRAVVVVFSDGTDTSSWLAADRVLQAARRADAVVYGVRTRGSRTNAFLSDLADATGGRVFDVGSTDVVRSAFTAILGEFRQRYLISYTPRNVKRAGSHTIQVRPKARDLKVKARAGYLAGPD